MMRAVLLSALMLLGGCISLLPEPPPPPRLFALEVGGVAPAAGPRVDAVIAVATPGGERAILGTDLIWRAGDELALVAQTQWSSRAEQALHSMLLETLAAQGAFAAVARAGEGRADYEVRWDVLDFEVRESDMSAHFAADVRVLALPTRAIVAQRRIEALAPVADRSASLAAEALARAARQGSARIGEFALEAAANAEAQAAGR
jgi:ABC-type uncharacterized transport system auxiliary subunit